MKKLLFTFLTVLFCNSPICIAQITFQKTFGGTGDEEGLSGQQTSDGGYILCGYTTSFGAGGRDVYLIKTNQNGSFLWAKTYGDIGDEIGNSIQQTTDGGYIIAGKTNSFGAGLYDVLLIKTNSNGDTLWTKTFGGTSYESANAVQQTNDGGFIVTGLAYSFGTGTDDVYLIKADSNGSLQWSKTFSLLDDEIGSSVTQNSDSGYIILGHGKSPIRGYCIRTNSSGDTLWTETHDNDSDYRGQQTSDGGFILVGDGSYLGTKEVYLVKLNPTGDTLWTKTYGVTANDGGTCVKATTDGGFIISGFTDYLTTGFTNVYLIKTDSLGNVIWDYSYGGINENDIGNSVQQTTDNGYIVIGTTYSLGNGGADIYLIKTDPNGNSGCLQYNPAAILHSPSTLVTKPVTQVSSGGIVNSTNMLTPGSGNSVLDLCSSVGLSEITNSDSLFVYPNPANEYLNITFKHLITKGRIEIFSLIGQRIFTTTIENESNKKIFLKSFSDGIYFVKVFDEEKSYCTKLIVEHN